MADEVRLPYSPIRKSSPSGTRLYCRRGTFGSGPRPVRQRTLQGRFPPARLLHPGGSFSLASLPTSGKVGASIKILGTNLTGATNVTFNGTATVFTVLSPSLITTAVPTGATTGTVQVVTPGGTLSSNVAFQVLP